MPDLELVLNMGDTPLANKTRPRFRDPVALFGWSLTEEHWELPWWVGGWVKTGECAGSRAWNSSAWQCFGHVRRESLCCSLRSAHGPAGGSCTEKMSRLTHFIPLPQTPHAAPPAGRILI